MLTWRPSFQLDPSLDQPLFLQIAQRLGEAITEGRLTPGEALPGTRVMAEHLDVNRNTVVAAYQELSAEGWIQSRPGGGTFVADPPPRSGTQAGSKGAPEPAFNINPPPGQPAVQPHAAYSFLTGEVDPRLLPMVALARAYQRAVRTRDRTLFSRDQPLGVERFRTALASMLASAKGLRASADTLLVTSGLAEAISLVCRGLLPSGEMIGVEALGSWHQWDVLRQSGHPLLPIIVDGEGVSITSARQALDAGARMLFVTPLRQYPTTVTLPASRRADLLVLAQQAKVPILEVDLDPGFHYEGSPALPLAAEDRTGSVVYIGAFSRLLFPNLPVAFIHGPSALIQSLSAWRSTLGSTGDPFLQQSLAQLLEDGEIQRHLHRLRKVSLECRDALGNALERHLASALEIRPPSGGQAFWLPTRDAGVDVDAWARRARKDGLAFQPGHAFALEGEPPAALRLGFGGSASRDMEEAVLRMARALID